MEREEQFIVVPAMQRQLQGSTPGRDQHLVLHHWELFISTSAPTPLATQIPDVAVESMARRKTLAHNADLSDDFPLTCAALRRK